MLGINLSISTSKLEKINKYRGITTIFILFIVLCIIHPILILVIDPFLYNVRYHYLSDRSYFFTESYYSIIYIILYIPMLYLAKRYNRDLKNFIEIKDRKKFLLCHISLATIFWIIQFFSIFFFI